MLSVAVGTWGYLDLNHFLITVKTLLTVSKTSLLCMTYILHVA